MFRIDGNVGWSRKPVREFRSLQVVPAQRVGIDELKAAPQGMRRCDCPSRASWNPATSASLLGSPTVGATRIGSVRELSIKPRL